MTFRGLGIWDLARDYWVRVRDLGSSWGAFPRRAVKQWVEEERTQTSTRAEDGRSGDPGLGVRNKEQWSDCLVMTANTRVRWQHSVSRSSGIRQDAIS